MSALHARRAQPFRPRVLDGQRVMPRQSGPAAPHYAFPWGWVAVSAVLWATALWWVWPRR